VTGGGAAPGDLWVFAYGSLMWRPDFEHDEARIARLAGHHRAMCILSSHYRGTPDRPGLVLGLDRGGCCVGLAFRVEAARAGAVERQLHERELVSGVYLPRHLPVTLDDGRRPRALAYVADRRHPQYFGAAGSDAAVALVRQGHGSAGSSRDYLAQTVEKMRALGIRDGALHALLARVDAQPG
jgi:cation transport protein ChaC